MATQLIDRPALWLRRSRLVQTLGQQRMALAVTCGCVACGGQAARTQLGEAIRDNMRALDALNDRILDATQQRTT